MDFRKLTDYLNHLPGEGVPGLELAVWMDHQPIYRHRAGQACGGETYWLFSVTKVLTMTVLMRLIEKGTLHLSDPVAGYLPAFGRLTVRDGDSVRPARTVLTLEHLMAMQGGLDYDQDTPAIRQTLAETDGKADTVRLAQCFSQKPLLFDPGLGFRYSLCHDAAGACAVAATGKPLSVLAKELVTEPLGIRDLTFHPDENQLARLSPLYTLDAEGRTVPTENRRGGLADLPNYESGGGGLLGDVDSCMLLADALACGGVGRNGARILTVGSIDNMRTNRQSGPSMEDFRRVRHKRGYGYGLGVRTLIDQGTSKSPIGEFGWDGAAGAWMMMDPEHRIAAFYTQHVLNMNRAYYEFHPAIRDLIYDGIGL